MQAYLVDGFRRREVRTALRRLFLDASDWLPARDETIHSEDVYNIYRSVQDSFVKENGDQKESVKSWLAELEGQQFKVFVHPTYNESFSFGYMAPWQLQVLNESNAFCLDVTHGISDFHGDAQLYTHVVRHSQTGTDCPVVYFSLLINQQSLCVTGCVSSAKIAALTRQNYFRL